MHFLIWGIMRVCVIGITVWGPFYGCFSNYKPFTSSFIRQLNWICKQQQRVVCWKWIYNLKQREPNNTDNRRRPLTWCSNIFSVASCLQLKTKQQYGSLLLYRNTDNMVESIYAFFLQMEAYMFPSTSFFYSVSILYLPILCTDYDRFGDRTQHKDPGTAKST